MDIDKIKRIDQLSLYSPLSLRDFSLAFRTTLELPELMFDFENETEWAEANHKNIYYNISHPYENGVLTAWDSTTPAGCNFGISLGISNNHSQAHNEQWLIENIIMPIGKKLNQSFATSVYYHRTWFAPGKNEIKNIVFNT